MLLFRLFSSPRIPFPLIYKAACQNHPTLYSPDQMPPPKVTASYRVRASGAHRDPPDTVLTFQKSSLLPPDHNTTRAANSRDSAKLSAGTMTQTQSSVLSPNFNTSWLWSQECQVWRTELCFWNNAFISPCTVFVWISGNSHTMGGGQTELNLELFLSWNPAPAT